TRAILRSAEFGFFGVMVLTCRHTPRFCGLALRSLTLLIGEIVLRGRLISWLIVGISILGNRLTKAPRRAGRAPEYTRIPPGVQENAGRLRIWECGLRICRNWNRLFNPHSAIQNPKSIMRPLPHSQPLFLGFPLGRFAPVGGVEGLVGLDRLDLQPGQ